MDEFEGWTEAATAWVESQYSNTITFNFGYPTGASISSGILNNQMVKKSIPRSLGCGYVGG